MNNLINFNQYQQQQQRQRQQEQYRQQQIQEQYRQQQQQELYRQLHQQQEQHRHQQQKQEQYRQQQQQHRDYYMPFNNQPPVRNRENYEPNVGYFGSSSGQLREQGLPFGPSRNPSRSRWPIDELDDWFNRPFTRESPDFSPERQNDVVDRNRSTNKSMGTGYIGFKPEPKRHRIMERTKVDNREGLEPIKEAMSMCWEPVQPDTTNLAAVTSEEDADQEIVPEPDNKLKICLKPVGYPEKKLNYKDKIQLEEAIIEEVRLSRGAGGLQLLPPLRFTAIQYRLGYVEVRCFNQETAQWLLSYGSKLSTYQGAAVEALQETMPDRLMHPISVYLPRSAGKPDGYIRELLKAQNALKIEMWQITQRNNYGPDCVVRFDIDDESAKDIAANDHKIFYRLSTVAVAGLEKLDRSIAKSVKQFGPPPKPASDQKTAELNESFPVPIEEKGLFTIDLASDNEENEQNLAIKKRLSGTKRSAAKNPPLAVLAVTEVVILEDKVDEKGTNANEAEESSIVWKQGEESKIEDMQAAESNIVETPLEEKHPIEMQETVVGEKPIEATKALNKDNIQTKVAKEAKDTSEAMITLAENDSNVQKNDKQAS